MLICMVVWPDGFGLHAMFASSFNVAIVFLWG